MEKEIGIPEGVEVRLEENEIIVKGPKGELRRGLPAIIKAGVEGNRVVLKTEGKKDPKKVRAAIGTWNVHIRNMFTGVTQMWEARLKAVYSHFPLRQSVEGNTLVIQNFLGEKKHRSARILDGVKVDVRKEEVVVTGADIESVGQTCGNIEAATKVRGYDRRVFQDGIYIVQKCRPAGEV